MVFGKGSKQQTILQTIFITDKFFFNYILEWKGVPVVAVKTVGANCFNKSIQAGEIVGINITSIAKSLGARLDKETEVNCTMRGILFFSVAPTLMQMLPNFNVRSEVVV